MTPIVAFIWDADSVSKPRIPNHNDTCNPDHLNSKNCAGATSTLDASVSPAYATRKASGTEKIKEPCRDADICTSSLTDSHLLRSAEKRGHDMSGDLLDSVPGVSPLTPGTSRVYEAC